MVNGYDRKTSDGRAGDRNQAFAGKGKDLPVDKNIWFYMGIVSFLIATFLLVWFIILPGGAVAEALEERAQGLKDLSDGYNALMTSFNGKMTGLCDMQVDWSQHVLNGKKDDFCEFLMRLEGSPEKLGGAEADTVLAGVLSKLVKVWLTVFEECSRNPLREPLKVITEDSKIDSWKTVTEIAGNTAALLNPIKIEFMELPEENKNKRGSVWNVDTKIKNHTDDREEMIKKAQATAAISICSWCDIFNRNMDYEPPPTHMSSRQAKKCFPCECRPFNTCCCCCYLCGDAIRINTISSKHMAFKLYTLWMLLIFLFNLYIANKALSIMTTFLGFWFMIVIVIRFEKFDVLAQMQASQNQMQLQKDAILQKGVELDQLYQSVADPANIWVYRTRPTLDIINGLSNKLLGSKWPSTQAAKEFLETVLQALELLSNGYGGLDIWCVRAGKPGKCLSLDAMKYLRQRAEKVMTHIKKSSAHEVQGQLLELCQMPNLLVVRVKRCTNLPQGSLMDNYDPYVRLRVKKDGKWLKTAAFDNTQNPDWSEKLAEFRFIVRSPDTTVLDVEVMDENSVGSDTYIGCAAFPVNEMQAHGRWRTLRKKLEDAEHGEVELEVYFASDSSSLVALMPAPAVSPVADAGGGGVPAS